MAGSLKELSAHRFQRAKEAYAGAVRFIGAVNAYLNAQEIISPN